MEPRNSAIRNRLIIFTRYPQPGKTKTRLISALGPEGASDLHRRMAEYTLVWARKLKNSSAVSLEIRFAEGNQDTVKNWLGPDIPCSAQGSGDLGQRMERAFGEAFQTGMERVIIVGTDCPGLDERLAQKAFETLHDNELVLGPAKDGGYYLIGLRRPGGELFRGIPWSTSEVLAKTLQIARHLHLRVSLLEPLDDVDRPEDLPVWEKFAITSSHPSPLAGEGKGGGDFPLISIIIPTLNEEENIASCLASTRNAPHVERIVVDGGSKDRTLEIALSCGAKVLSAPTGRARQMNAGAESAAGDLLLFLHADTRLSIGFAETVRHTLSLPSIVAGAFEFRLDVTSPRLQFIHRAANWRSRRLQLPYGDQAIFLRSTLFREIGGFPDLPIMEDFEFIRWLKKKGRIHTAFLPAITSARRWKTIGVWRTTLINQVVIMAYCLGVSPSRLAGWYRRKS